MAAKSRKPKVPLVTNCFSLDTLHRMVLEAEKDGETELSEACWNAIAVLANADLSTCPGDTVYRVFMTARGNGHREIADALFFQIHRRFMNLTHEPLFMQVEPRK